MSGFLSNLARKRPSTAKTHAKELFPFRDEDDPRIVYKLSDRARRISLKVNTAEREVSVIVPGVNALSKAKKFARDQKDWIDVQLEALPPPMPFVPGQQVLMRGELYELISPPSFLRG